MMIYVRCEPTSHLFKLHENILLVTQAKEKRYKLSAESNKFSVNTEVMITITRI